MESIASKIKINQIIPKRPTTGTPENANSERNWYVGKFTDKLNLNRGKYPPLKYPRVAKMLAHLSLQDLNFFWKKCDSANNFSQCFWGLLKTNQW